MFNLAVTFIAAALLAPSAVVGQDVTACLTNCTTLALPAGPCTGLTDLACICTSNDVISSIAACIAQDCPTELANAEAAQTTECAPYANGTDTSSTSDTGSGSTSAAVVTPGGTTSRAPVTPAGTTTRAPTTTGTSHATSSTSTTSTGAGFHTASIASGVTLALFGAAFSLF